MSDRELQAMQETFAAALFEGEAGDACLAHIQGERALAQRRLAIYRSNSMASAERALVSAFPIVKKLVGDDFFRGLTRIFWRTEPPTSGDLNDYGAGFAHFLARSPHTQDVPYLPDVARLEWLLHRAYAAADPQTREPCRLPLVDVAAASRLRAVLAPACAVLASRWPLHQLWAVHQDDYAGAMAVAWRPERVLVWREGYVPRASPLDPAPYAFLEAARGGRSLEEALAGALHADPHFDFARALREWIGQRVVIGFA